MPNEITDFLKGRETKSKSQVQNWQKIKSEWLDEIDKFFEMVRTWLSEPVAEGLVKISEGKTIISEENIGRYQVPTLTIMALNNTFRFNPVGRLVIGSKGRIDMETPKGEIMLLLGEKGWVYVIERPRITYVKFNEKEFIKLLKGLFE
jgi:hypothetical protein